MTIHCVYGTHHKSAFIQMSVRDQLAQSRVDAKYYQSNELKACDHLGWICNHTMNCT